MTPLEKLAEDARKRPPLRDVLAATGMSAADVERCFWPIAEFVDRALQYQRERAALIAEKHGAHPSVVLAIIRNNDN